jgi:peptidoglycan/LPS O-acetylase OafA/YrhL
MNDARRIACLDGLRGIAAIVVMEFHFAIFFLPQARLFDLIPALGRAYLAVDLFFILSGFVMAHVYGKALASSWREEWPAFAIARFARLYPLFAVSTIAMAFVFALSHIGIESVSFSGRSLALQPFLLQQWGFGLNWNYPSWSISTEVEAYIYFVFSAGLLLTGRRPLIIAACCIIALVVCASLKVVPSTTFQGLALWFGRSPDSPSVSCSTAPIPPLTRELHASGPLWRPLCLRAWESSHI